jgi:hypothetical protein
MAQLCENSFPFEQYMRENNKSRNEVREVFAAIITMPLHCAHDRGPGKARGGRGEELVKENRRAEKETRERWDGQRNEEREIAERIFLAAEKRFREGKCNDSAGDGKKVTANKTRTEEEITADLQACARELDKVKKLKERKLARDAKKAEKGTMESPEVGAKGKAGNPKRKDGTGK